MKSNFDERKAHQTSDTLPDQAGVYVPPRPVAPLSDHRTMDIKAIRLAAELDPRQARTQLRMQAPRRRRRWSPFWFASIGLGVLLGVGVYLAFLSDMPLPLFSSDQRAEPPAQPAVLVEQPLDTVAPSPRAPPELAPRTAGTATATPAPTSEELTTPVEPPARAAPAPTQRSAPPRKSKPRRDPWLE
jgi:hypothetical protein